MDNWEKHDENLRNLKERYNNLYKQLQTYLQNIFDRFNFNKENLDKAIDAETKSKINKQIKEMQENQLEELYTGTFRNFAMEIYNKSIITYRDMLRFLVYEAYIAEETVISYFEQPAMYQTANFYYQEGIKEVNETLPKEQRNGIFDLNFTTFMTLLLETKVFGNTWSEYKNIVVEYNATNLFQQALYNIEHEKELKINSREFQKLLNVQINQRLSINKDKISGAIDNEMIALNNLAKIQAINDVAGENSIVEFCAIEDEETTPMCQSLDGQRFNLDEMNEYYRWFGETKNDIEYTLCHTQGLEIGMNLPPIDNYYHHCRSTVRYIAE